MVLSARLNLFALCLIMACEPQMPQGTDYPAEETKEPSDDAESGRSTTPSPETPVAPGPQAEGESCAEDACSAALSCVPVYSRSTLLGRFCMEPCQTLGADPACEAGEICSKSKDGDPVCFNPKAAEHGYTTGESAGADSGTQSPETGGNSGGSGTGGNDTDGSGEGGSGSGGTGSGGVDVGPPPVAGACGMSQIEADVVTHANEARAAAGSGPLVCDEKGVIAARKHSEDMCARGYFSHDNPEGQGPDVRLRAAGARFMQSGENISTFRTTARAVHEGWMHSTGHRRNILHPGFNRIGIGYSFCGGRPYWTQVFMD